MLEICGGNEKKLQQLIIVDKCMRGRGAENVRVQHRRHARASLSAAVMLSSVLLLYLTAIHHEDPAATELEVSPSALCNPMASLSPFFTSSRPSLGSFPFLSPSNERSMNFKRDPKLKSL